MTSPDLGQQEYSRERASTPVAVESVRFTPQARVRFRRVADTLRGVHASLGGWYWFIMVPLTAITLHTIEPIAAIVWSTSPRSDTFVANSISYEGFLLWHSILTIVDCAMTVFLIYLVYTRWKSAAGMLRRKSVPAPVDA